MFYCSQIIIEGVRGTSYVSDLAIDDVAILQAEECTQAKKIDSDTTARSVTTNDGKYLIIKRGRDKTLNSIWFL